MYKVTSTLCLTRPQIFYLYVCDLGSQLDGWKVIVYISKIKVKVQKLCSN